MAEYSSIYQITCNILAIIGCVLLSGPFYTYIIFNNSDVCPKCLAGNALAFASYIFIGGLAICSRGKCYIFYRTNTARYSVKYFMPIDIVLALFTLTMGAVYADGLYDKDTHYKCLAGNAVSWATLIVITIWIHARKYYMSSLNIVNVEAAPIPNATYAMNGTYASVQSTHGPLMK